MGDGAVTKASSIAATALAASLISQTPLNETLAAATLPPSPKHSERDQGNGSTASKGHEIRENRLRPDVDLDPARVAEVWEQVHQRVFNERLLGPELAEAVLSGLEEILPDQAQLDTALRETLPDLSDMTLAHNIAAAWEKRIEEPAPWLNSFLEEQRWGLLEPGISSRGEGALRLAWLFSEREAIDRTLRFRGEDRLEAELDYVSLRMNGQIDTVDSEGVKREIPISYSLLLPAISEVRVSDLSISLGLKEGEKVKAADLKLEITEDDGMGYEHSFVRHFSREAESARNNSDEPSVEDVVKSFIRRIASNSLFFEVRQHRMDRSEEIEKRLEKMPERLPFTFP